MRTDFSKSFEYFVFIIPASSLEDQIAADEANAKLEKQIEGLEKKARTEKQPRKRLELFEQLKKLKESVNIR